MKLEQWANAPEFLIGGLAYAFFWMDESLQRSMEASGFTRVKRTQSLMMIYVGAGVDRPSDLAKMLGISRQAVHQALREMNANNLLELVPDPKDKRAKIIRFCEGAAPVREAAAKILLDIEGELNKRVGQKEISNLKKCLLPNWGDILSIDINLR